MPIPYSPPGINVSELTTPSVLPTIAPPGVVAVVGLASGFIRKTDAVTLVGTTAVALPTVTSVAGATMTVGAIVSVKAADPSVNFGAYTYNNTNGYGSAEYTFSNTAKTIVRVGTGGGGAAGVSAIPDGSTVYVTYNYLPANYFIATKFSDLASIEERYGSAYDPTGTLINSPLSFGAMVALENGARQVYCAPLFSLTTPTDPTSARNQPSSEANAYTQTVWQQTLTGLRDFNDVNIVVPIAGEKSAVLSDATAIFGWVQDHIYWARSNGQYIMGILGSDTTQGVAISGTTLRTNAGNIASQYGGLYCQQLALINSTKFGRRLPNTGQTWFVGGQYMAAAIAGMLSSAPANQPITRQQPSGFISTDYKVKSEKVLDGGVGLLVIDDLGNNQLQIRHGLTLDNTSTASREISVVRTKHVVISSVQSTLNSQILGKVFPAGDAPLVVATAASGVLELLKQGGNIVDYHSVAARTLANIDPTTIELRFSYKPAFPVNYINIVFSLDTTNNTISVH